MAEITLSLPDELLNYLQQKETDPNALIQRLVQQGRQQHR